MRREWRKRRGEVRFKKVVIGWGKWSEESEDEEKQRKQRTREWEYYPKEQKKQI